MDSPNHMTQEEKKVATQLSHEVLDGASTTTTNTNTGEVKKEPLNVQNYLSSEAVSTSQRLSMFSIPFFDVVLSKKRILLAGCGGGFDIYSGLPIFFALKKLQKEVFLANLTFVGELPELIADFATTSPSLHIHSAVLPVTANLASHISQSANKDLFPSHYFPEFYLSEWFQKTQNLDVPVYTITRSGVVPVRAAYEAICEKLQIDCIVLVDGGTDSLMRGDEIGLGSPEEDSVSIVAVNGMKQDFSYLSKMGEQITKIMLNIGVGVDSFHGVRHGQWLRNVAREIEAGGYLGCFALMREMVEVELYKMASEYVFKRMPTSPSIVVSSTLAAIDGKFGNYHANSRTRGSKMYINPLMGLVWCFELATVAKDLMYADKIEQTKTMGEVRNIILKFRNTVQIWTEWSNIPH